MAVGFSNTNKPLNPRGQDASPKAYNRAKLFSGKALDFDGVNDNIIVNGVDSVFDYGNAYTMAGYFKIVDGGSGSLMGNSNGNAFGNFLGFVYKSGDDSNFYPDGSSSNFVTIYSGNTTDFVHIVCTSDGTTAKAYLNGQLVGSTSVSSYTNTSSRFNVGSSYSGNFGEHEAAGVKIFNTALTATQIADLYNNPEKVVPTGVANTALKLWLPMQEGAGTTAYDGSGNGNHGTISGATYVHGIGAPVAQTAVIDWNKGTNIIPNSLDIINANFTNNQVSSVSGFEAPDGTLTASKITKLGGSSYLAFNGVANNDKRAIYAKTTSGTGQLHLLTHNSNTNNLFTITEEWQKFSIDSVTSSTGETSFYLVDFRGSSTLSEVIIWAPNSSTLNYNIVPTLATAQTSPVLLPQGLTTGRDITGVNLFENVRKQGALNLDGNSWAEVHDNASLDVTTGVSVECWFYNVSGANNTGLFGSWTNTDSEKRYLLYKFDDDDIRFYVRTATTETNQQTGNAVTTDAWHHVVGTYDRTYLKIYIDGIESGTKSFGGDIQTTDVPITIGRWDNDSNYAYPADIAQPRIYNRALTAAEVLQNYNSGKNTYK